MKDANVTIRPAFKATVDDKEISLFFAISDHPQTRKPVYKIVDSSGYVYASAHDNSDVQIRAKAAKWPVDLQVRLKQTLDNYRERSKR